MGYAVNSELAIVMPAGTELSTDAHPLADHVDASAANKIIKCLTRAKAESDDVIIALLSDLTGFEVAVSADTNDLESIYIAYSWESWRSITNNVLAWLASCGVQITGWCVSENGSSWEYATYDNELRIYKRTWVRSEVLADLQEAVDRLQDDVPFEVATLVWLLT